MIRIPGYCPMGCGQTLFLGEGGYLVCSYLHCPRPDAASDILDDREVEHVVAIGETGFTTRHPLRERLDDALLDCSLDEHLRTLAGPPVKPGKYRALSVDAAWKWHELGDGE